jgi:MoxR-like ATPase
MAIPEYTAEIQNLGTTFYAQGMAELGKIVYGESEARTAILAGLVGSSAVVLSGMPGGAKSLLSRNTYRLFEDMTKDDVAVVPPASDLLPIQLVGGAMETQKTVHSNGDSYNENTTVRVEPIVKDTHKIIWLDELTRINPEAVNQLLSAPEERELKTTAGVVPLPNLQLMVSTMNPSESRQATFPVTAAFASRHSLGAIMGYDLTQEGKLKLAKGELPDVATVEPVTTIEQLQRLRAAVNSLAISNDGAEQIVKLVETAESALKNNYNIVEAGRMFGQVGKTARILALFEGKTPHEQHINQAVRFALAARLGSRVVRQEALAELNEVHERVIAA